MQELRGLQYGQKCISDVGGQKDLENGMISHITTPAYGHPF